MTHQQTALDALHLQIDVTIRPAQEEDVARLEWFGQFWQFRRNFESAYRDHLAGRRLMLVGDFNGFPIARLYLQMAPGNPLYSDGYSRGYLYSLAVMEPFQNLGIGTRLIQAGEQALIERGFQWAVIAVAQDNPRARTLYERLGFSVFHEETQGWQYRDPDGITHYVDEPCWVLEKRLVPDLG